MSLYILLQVNHKATVEVHITTLFLGGKFVTGRPLLVIVRNHRSYTHQVKYDGFNMDDKVSWRAVLKFVRSQEINYLKYTCLTHVTVFGRRLQKPNTEEPWKMLHFWRTIYVIWPYCIHSGWAIRWQSQVNRVNIDLVVSIFRVGNTEVLLKIFKNKLKYIKLILKDVIELV